MRPPLDRRTLIVLAAALVPPLGFVLSGRSPASPVLAAAAIAAAAAGLVRLEAALRAIGDGAVSVATAVLVLYGTGLLWYEVIEPAWPALGFALATFLVAAAWGRTPARGQAMVLGTGMGLGLGALSLAVEFLAGDRPALVLGAPPLLDSLFSSRHGLLFWTPLLTLAILGLLERAWRGRPEAMGALAALAALAALNSVLRPWWSGGLGNARFLPALPLFALGLSRVLDILHATARRRPLRLAAAAGALLVGWNLLLMAEYRREMVPRDDTVAFPALVGSGAQLVASAAGAPVAWPANWVYARREGLPVGRYDLLAGQDVLAGGPARIDLADPDLSASLLADGWSVRHPCGDVVCREIEGGRARMFLPVVDPRPAELRVRAAGTGSLRLTLNGTLLAESALASALADVDVPLAREALRRGPNALVLETSPGGRAWVEAVTVVPRTDAR